MEALLTGLILFLVSITLDTRVRLAKMEVKISKIEKMITSMVNHDCGEEDRHG